MTQETAELLWLGYEDVSGLWEVTWDSDRGEAESESSKMDRRINTFVELMRSGLIEVVIGPTSYDFETSHRLTPDEAAEILRDPTCWRGPDPDDDIGEHVVRYRTTDAGFAAYRAATGWQD